MFLSSPRNAWAGFDSQGGFCESQGRFRAGFSQPALRVKIVWGRVGSLIVKSPHTIRNMFDGWFEIPTPFTVRTNPSNSHSQIETPMFPSIFLRGPSRFFFQIIGLQNTIQELGLAKGPKEKAFLSEENRALANRKAKSDF